MRLEIINESTTDELTEDNVNEIIKAMQMAEIEYPECGYCDYRARYIRDVLNFGQVMTFSKEGDSAEDIYDSYPSESSFIRIPHSPSCYRGETFWAYHTVFMYKNYVFTYEIENWYCPLKDYRSRLNLLNGFTVKAYNEKVVGKYN